jgi:excisionase family DNA binding protein
MGKSACWSYVTWYNKCSGGNWATWEPGDVVSPGDVGRFDKERRFCHWETLGHYNVSYTVSEEMPVASHLYATGKAFRVETKVAEQSAVGFVGLGRLDAGVRITAEREHACLLQLREATESRITETRSLLNQIATLLRDGKWDLDLVVVTRRVRARNGFAAISQGAGQSVELKAIGEVRLAEVLEVGDSELLLASDRSTSGFLLYEFGTRETPVFFPPIRVRHDLWDRLLPWRSEGPWLIDPAGGRHDSRNLPTDLSNLAPKARRYHRRHSAMTLSELSTITVDGLFEQVTSLPPEHGSEISQVPIPERSRRKPGRARSESAATTPIPPAPSRAPSSRAAVAETPLTDVRFLTVAEVALVMRVSKMTVYRLVHSGELEAIRVGRSFRVPEQAVNQYLRAAFVGHG